MIWATAIFAELAGLTIFGYESFASIRFVLSGAVLLVGTVGQVLFQGEGPLEILARLKRRSMQHSYSLDKVYSAFVTDRAIRLVFVAGVLTIVVLTVKSFEGSRTPVVILLLMGSSTALARAGLVKWRVDNHCYGTNATEAADLIRFLVTMYNSSPRDFQPPSQLRETNERGEPSSVPSGAEFAG